MKNKIKIMKTISLIILCLFFSCKETNKNELKEKPIKHALTINSQSFKNKGMNYRIYTKSASGGGIYVVNETLDSLKVELIKKQIKINK